CATFNSKYRVIILPRKAGDALTVMQKEDFKDRLAGQYLTTLSGKQKNKSEVWLQHLARNTFEKVEFLPGILQENCPSDTLNKFTGWPIEPVPDPSKCTAFLDLINNYIASNPLQANWIINFFAHILRTPMDKQRSALVIIGPQNMGKSVFVNYFGRILGRHHLSIADAVKIHGRFNAHLEQCLLLHSDEAIYGQDKKHKSIIKDLISNKLISFEEKYLG